MNFYKARRSSARCKQYSALRTTCITCMIKCCSPPRYRFSDPLQSRDDCSLLRSTFRRLPNEIVSVASPFVKGTFSRPCTQS